MTVNLGPLIVVGLVIACGVYLLLERSLTRMLLGFLLIGNGANLFIVTVTGAMGNPPILGETSSGRDRDADSLAQALVLTSIVITLGIGAFILALAYRNFVNNTNDSVPDDVEDTKLLVPQRITDAPDRDRSDDEVTGSDTDAGDYFDDDGNPLSAAEIRRRIDAITATDGDSDDEFHDDDSTPDDPTTNEEARP